MSLVRILALCQALLFLALFLFLCAQAGAVTESNRSVYAPEAVRDPFGSGAARAAGVLDNEKAQAEVPSVLKLKGILYHAVHPAAIVNDQLLELNKPVTVQTDQGGLEVRALQITREAVLLQVGGQRVELRLGGGEHDKITQ